MAQKPKSITFHIEGQPVPQPRARVSSRGGFARAYVTAKPMVDPTPAEIAERCAEIRQKNNLKHRRTGHPDPQPGRIVSRAAAADPTFFKSFCDGVL